MAIETQIFHSGEVPEKETLVPRARYKLPFGYIKYSHILMPFEKSIIQLSI